MGRPLQPQQGLDEELQCGEQAGWWGLGVILCRFHLFYYSNGNSGKDKKNAKDTMLIIDTRGKQAATVVEKTPIEEDADVEQDPLELAIRTKYVAFLWVET